MYVCVGTRGLVIDCCWNEHETREEAEQCLLENLKVGREAGRASNRQVFEVENLQEIDEDLLY